MRKRRKTVFYFIFGCICGFFIEYLLRKKLQDAPPIANVVFDKNYKVKNYAILNDMNVLYGKDIQANKLAKEIKILCWVLTNSVNVESKAKAVRDTWGRHCNILIFISSSTNKDFPTVSLNVEEGYNNLWLKTKAAWRYVYENYYHQANWFLKADDDTFVIVENLRYFLSQYKHKDSHFFGRNLWTQTVDYNSGGAGYVFSRETLRKFSAVQHQCDSNQKAEDIATAVCLKKIGITADDTRDEQGRELFHPFAPDFHLIPGAIEKTNWLYRLSKWEVNTGPDCCSKYSISFHYTSPKRMYLFYYYLYRLKTV